MDARARAAILLVLVAGSWVSCGEAIRLCDEVGSSPCHSCGAVGVCKNDSSISIVDQFELCRDGQVCEEDEDGEGRCVDLSDDSDCRCKAFEYGCDPYDDQAVTACLLPDPLYEQNIFLPNIVHMCGGDERCSADATSKCELIPDSTTTTTTTSTTTTTPTTTTTTSTTTTTPTSTTTTTPTTTTTNKPAECDSSNNNARYPHETDCKKYYTCREVRRGIYAYVTSTCPSVLMFDPKNLWCDLPQNVECKV